MRSELYRRVAARVGRPALQLLGTRQETLTFFGGTPCVSEPFDWPRRKGKPLSFLGQLDLLELDLGDAAPWLPGAGRLLFFYDLDDGPWGFDPEDEGGWAVLHDAGSGPPVPVPLPDELGDELRIPGVRFLRGNPYLSIPGLERISLEEAGISEEEEEDYWSLTADAFAGRPLHQVGGFPEAVQGDSMEEECQLVSGGVYCGEPEGFDSARAEELRKVENDWRLLLQFDTDDDLDVMWGDSGTLYFWIRERDARARDFSNVWFVLQCC